MYEMEGALLGLPIQAGRFAWQHRLRRADRRGQPPASGSGFPAPSAPSGVSPGFGARFRRESISTPQPHPAQAPGQSNHDYFRHPQNGGRYPRMTGVTHCLIHSISTGHRLLPPLPGQQHPLRNPAGPSRIKTAAVPARTSPHPSRTASRTCRRCARTSRPAVPRSRAPRGAATPRLPGPGLPGDRRRLLPARAGEVTGQAPA